MVLTGDGVHVVVDDATAACLNSKPAEVRAGVPFDQFRSVTPSIEDLFVDAVTGGTERRS